MPEKICLTTMLKNEAENVLNTLHSVEGLWDYCVCGFDETSDDGTEEIVREYLKGRNVYYYTFPWRDDFSYARNLYLDAALEHFPDAKYALLLDGDDVLHPASRSLIPAWLADPNPQYAVLNAYVYLDCDPYGVPMLFYPRVHIIRNIPRIRFRFASHNIIEAESDEQLLVRDFIILHTQKPKKRAMREKQRVDMNIPNLQRQAAETDHPARPLFYEGNTHLDAGNLPAAEQAFVTYLERSTWHEERYQAMLHLAGIRFTAGDLAGAQDWAWRALREPGQWNRAEAYMLLGDAALADGKVGEAIHWLEITSNMPPPVSSLFLQGSVYTWLPHWRLTLLYDRIGAFQLALEHAMRAKHWRPAADLKTAVKVLESCVQQWGPGGGMPGEGAMALDPNLPLATELRPITEAALMEELNKVGQTPVAAGGV